MKFTRKNISKTLTYLVLTLGIVIVVLPMIYMVSTALKPNGALYEYPPKFFPKLKEFSYCMGRISMG